MMTNRDLRFAPHQHSESSFTFCWHGSVTGALSVYEDFTMYTLRHRFVAGWSCLWTVRTPGQKFLPYLKCGPRAFKVRPGVDECASWTSIRGHRLRPALLCKLGVCKMAHSSGTRLRLKVVIIQCQVCRWPTVFQSSPSEVSLCWSKEFFFSSVKSKPPRFKLSWTALLFSCSLSSCWCEVVVLIRLMSSGTASCGSGLVLY